MMHIYEKKTRYNVHTIYLDGFRDWNLFYYSQIHQSSTGFSAAGINGSYIYIYVYTSRVVTVDLVL